LTELGTPGPTVALVHDYLTQRGGAERVVLSMLKAFPGAPLHTSLYDAQGTYPEFRTATIRTSPLDRSSLLRTHHRLALPFLAPAFGRQRIEADVVICSSSGWAHGVGVGAGARKVVYCYSPARWLYDGRRYLGPARAAMARIAVAASPPLVRWDRKAAATADRYLTLSTAVRERIRDVYGIEAEILHPPPILDPTGPSHAPTDVEPGFFLCVSRLLPYKNVDAILAAFADLTSERLVVVGSGPERERLAAVAGPNVRFLGRVADEELRWLYRECVAVVAASYEDYGLTPLEGAVFGRPAVVLRAGGFLETVREGATGVFFDEPDPRRLVPALRTALTTEWSRSDLQDQAERFSEDRFVRRLREIVAEEARGGPGGAR
jgi:glycosyltransferase involved in cell wall biosynthesis